MCGILAIYRTSPKAADISGDELKTMARALAPNQTEGGSYALWDTFLGLGQTDCSGLRLEPLFNRSGTLALVAHATLTDRQAWLRKLRDRGVEFGAQTDNEILLYAYEQYGTGCFGEFTGKFAFLLWDAAKEVLIAARDSLGLSTLYYTEQQGRLYFASEIHSFFAKIGLEKRLNPRYFSDTLLGSHHPDDTPFGNLRAVPAGTFLVIDKDGKPDLQSFQNKTEFAGVPQPKAEDQVVKDPDTVAKELHASLWNLAAPVDRLSALGQLKVKSGPKTHPVLNDRLWTWPRYGIPKDFLPYLLHGTLRSVLPHTIEVFHYRPLNPHVETMTWRDVVQSPSGHKLLQSYLSLEELDDAQLFSPLAIKCVQGLWKCVPAENPFGRSLDSLMGLVLTCQILNRMFLKYRFTADALHYWHQVTPEQHLPMRSELLADDHPPIRQWAIPEFLESRKLSDWHRFVLRHTQLGNFVFHFISMLCFFVSPVVALVTKNPAWLLLFFISGMIGTAGHYIFKDGGVSVREATIKLMVPIYVLRMFASLLKGQYAQEIKNAQLARDNASGMKAAG